MRGKISLSFEIGVIMANPTLVKETKKMSSNMKAMRDKDREMVRGKFIFHEIPGGQLGFSFKKWPGDPVETFNLVDGQVYSLPLGVAKHLNKNCKYPIHAYAMDEDKKPYVKVQQWVRRCSFQSLEFIDLDDLTPEGNTEVKDMSKEETKV